VNRASKFLILKDLTYHRGAHVGPSEPESQVRIPAGSVFQAVPEKAWDEGIRRAMKRRRVKGIVVLFEGCFRIIERGDYKVLSSSFIDRR